MGNPAKPNSSTTNNPQFHSSPPRLQHGDPRTAPLHLLPSTPRPNNNQHHNPHRHAAVRPRHRASRNGRGSAQESAPREYLRDSRHGHNGRQEPSNSLTRIRRKESLDA